MPEIRFDTPYTAAEDPKAKTKDEGKSAGDYGRAFVSGGAKTVSDTWQFLAPETGKETRRAISEFGDKVADGMSPAAKKAMSRNLLDSSPDGLLSNLGDIPIQLVGSVAPSLVATGGAGAVAGLAARGAGALIGAAAGAQRVGATVGVLGAGYGMGGGDVTGNVQEVVTKATPKQLGEGDPNSLYTKYRKTMSDEDAREKITRDLADGYAQGYGVFSAVLNTVGPVGSMLRKATAGQGVKGAVKGGIRRAIGVEGLNEATDEFGGDLASQTALERGLGIPYNPAQAAERTAKGGVFGGITGGAGRIISGSERVTDSRAQEVPDDKQLALTQRKSAGAGSETSTGTLLDNSMQNAAAQVAAVKKAEEEQRAQQEQAVNSEVNAAPRSAIPEFDPMQERRQGWLGEDQGGVPQGGQYDRYGRTVAPQRGTNETGIEPSTAGPAASRDPFAEKRDAMRPDPAGIGPPAPGRRSVAGRLSEMEMLQQYADANNGVLDPTVIAAHLAQAGKSVDPREVLNYLGQFVGRGGLQQSQRAGVRGLPTFSMATERQGPQRPANVIPTDPFAEKRDAMRPGEADLRPNTEQYGPNDLPTRDPFAEKRDALRPGENPPNNYPKRPTSLDPFAEKRDAMRPGEADLRPNTEQYGPNDLPTRDPFAERRDARRPGEVIPPTRKLDMRKAPAAARLQAQAKAKRATEAAPEGKRAPAAQRSAPAMRVGNGAAGKPKKLADALAVKPSKTGATPSTATLRVRSSLQVTPAQPTPAAAPSRRAKATQPKVAATPAAAPAPKIVATPAAAPAPKAEKPVAPAAQKLKEKEKAKAEKPVAPKAAALKKDKAAPVEPAPAPAPRAATPVELDPNGPFAETRRRGLPEAKERPIFVKAADPRTLEEPDLLPVKTSPKVVPTVPPKRMTADQAKERALAAAPKGPDGKAKLGVINGVMRMVYNQGMPKAGQQRVTFGADWYDELTAKDRRDVVAILEGLRNAYGARLDRKRPLFTWINSEQGIERRAKEELDKLAGKYKVTRGGKQVAAPTRTAAEAAAQQDYLVSDKALVDGINSEFKGIIQKGDGDVEALVASIMADAKKEMEDGGLQALDYPQLLDTAKRRLAQIPASNKPRMIGALKQAYKSVQNGDERGNQITRAIETQIVAPMGSGTLFAANPQDRIKAQELSDEIVRKRDGILARYAKLPMGQSEARATLDAEAKAFNAEMGWSEEFNNLWQKVKDKTATEAEKVDFFKQAQGERGVVGASNGSPELILPEQMKVEADRMARVLQDASLQDDAVLDRTNRATDARLELTTFLKPDGTLRKMDTIRKNAALLMESYRRTGEEPSDALNTIFVYTEFRKGSRGRLAQDDANLREIYKKAAMEAALNWDADAEARLYAARERVVEATPQGVFNDFAPVPGESLQDTSERLTAMARTFSERQRSFRNKGGAMNVLTNTADPYTRFMKTLLDLTEGGTKPLLVEEPGRARISAERGDLSAKEQEDVKARIAKAEQKKGRPLDGAEKSKILSVVRSKRAVSKTAMRDTDLWRTIRRNLGEGRDEKLDTEADKSYRAQQTKFRDTVLGAKGHDKAVEAYVRRAHDGMALLANEFTMRFGNEVASTEALGAVLEDRNPFAAYPNPAAFADISRVSAIQLGSYSAAEAMEAAFPYGPTDQTTYGILAQLNAGLLSTLDQNNVKVNILTEEEYFQRPVKDRTSVGHYDPNNNSIYLIGGRNIIETAVTLQHEMVHAATYWGLENPQLAAEAATVLEELQGNAQLRKLVGDYPISTVDEMVAYGFSSPEAAAAFDTVPLSDATAKMLGLKPKATFWTWLVDAFRRIVNKPEINRNQTALQAILLLGNRAAVLQNNSGGPRGGRTDMALVYDQGLGDRLKRELSKSKTNLGPKGTKFMLALSTMTDMVQSYGKLFKWESASGREYLQLARQRNPLEQYENATAYEASQRQQLEQALKPFLERIDNLNRTNPKMAEQLNQLTLDASQANIDPTKATPPGRYAAGQDATSILNRQIHAELHARYNQLSDDAKDITQQISRVVSDMKEALVRGMTKTVLLTRWQQAQLDRKTPDAKLAPGFPDKADARTVEAAIDRILKNEQTADDVLWTGKTGHEMVRQFAKDIDRDGFYIPAYRSGDWVVFGKRTDFEVKAEFNSQAEALAEANRVRAKGGFVKRIYVRTYDPAGERVAYADRKSRKDLAEKFVVEAEPHIYEAFETRYDAEQRRNEMLKEGNADLRPVEPRESSQQNYLQALDSNQFAMLSNAVKSITVDEDKQKDLLAAFRDVSARLMPGATLRHSMIKRRNVIGAQTDLFRTMSKFVDASARYASTMEYAPYKESALQAMNDTRRNANDTSNPQRVFIIDELKGRAELATGGEAGTYARALQRLTSVWYLASPSYAAVQLLQPSMMGMPVLAKLNTQSSVSDIASEMKRAHDDVGGLTQIAGSGARSLRRTIAQWRKQATDGPVNLLEAIKRQVKESGAKDATEVSELLDELARRGRVDEHAGLEVSRDIKAEGNRAVQMFRMVEDFSRAFPTAAEAYNRSVMALAAYRLAIKNGESKEQAFFKAEQAIIDSQFVYNPHNTPSFFTKLQRAPYGGGLLAASFLTFKKFTQAMYMQMGRSLYDSVKGETPAIRKAAFRQFSLMMATHAAVAGLTGLPTEPLKLALGAIALLFGEDEPWDIDKMLIKKVNEQFGEEAGEVITKGLPRMINLDLSSRLGLEGLLFFKELKDFKKETLMAYFAEQMLGPQGGILAGAFDAGNTLRSGGSPTRALEQAMPKAVRDALAAWRWSEEGQTNLRGERIDEGLIGKGDAIWKALGFNSGMSAKVGAQRGEAIKEDRRLKLERSRLHQQMIKAQDSGDKTRVAEVQAKIDAFNEENPDNEVTDKTVTQSRRQRARYNDPARTYFGAPVKKGVAEKKSIYNLPSKSFTGESVPSPAARPAPLVTTPRETAAWTPDTEHPFFASIIKAEGTARDGDPYEEVLGYGRYGRPPKPLTEMTLAEAYNFGQEVIRPRHRADMGGKGSSALGAFQIVGSTMKTYMAAAGLEWDDLFDETNQRKLAYAIAQGQGVKPSTWEGFRANPRLLAAALADFEDMTEEDIA